jgi:hypothetical protein
VLLLYIIFTRLSYYRRVFVWWSDLFNTYRT